MIKLGGNWGTTNLSVFSLEGGDAMRGPKMGKGVSKLTRDEMVPALKELMGDEIQILLCGMVGSTIGVREVPYVPAPAGLGEIAAKVKWIEEGGLTIGIVPGVSCAHDGIGPDVMRGEETEILGALAQGHHGGTLCLPGTHTKWVEVEDGKITRFQTALTGELFDLLTQHSVLVRGTGPLIDGPFLEGVEDGKASLLHQLFKTRARQLIEGLGEDEARSYLSGLIIGHDITHAPKRGPITLIGSDEMVAAYGLACGALDIEMTAMSSLEASRAGLKAIAEEIA
ncbi:MAG: 2-dehydro-3-deoxygalactonokinase [Alphaproteobacteria bacterium]